MAYIDTPDFPPSRFFRGPVRHSPRPAMLPTLRAYSGLRVQAADCGAAPALARIGPLEVRLAATAKDVRRAQKLRYRVFYEEMAASPRAMTLLARRDVDAFDAVCDHMLVMNCEANRAEVVGTYRLLRQEVARQHGGFYSAREYDIGRLEAEHGKLKFLELGRSCVLAAYRDRRTVELLWRGIWQYVLRHEVDVMIGCASFPGTDPDRLAVPLSFLHHCAAAPAAWRVQALPRRYVEMNRIAKNAIDLKTAMRQLPPLIRGYLRLGAFVGHGAVIDRRFGTTDVFMVLPVAAISARYVDFFGAERRAA